MSDVADPLLSKIPNIRRWGRKLLSYGPPCAQSTTANTKKVPDISLDELQEAMERLQLEQQQLNERKLQLDRLYEAKEAELCEQQARIDRLTQQARADKRSAQYRHKQNLQHELTLKHMEENLRMQQQGLSPLANLSQLKYGRQAKEHTTPPQRTRKQTTNRYAHPAPAHAAAMGQHDDAEYVYPQEEDEPMTIPKFNLRESEWETASHRTAASHVAQGLVDSLMLIHEGVEDPREKLLKEIRSRFVQPSKLVKRKLAALNNQSTEALLEANQSLRAKQYAYKKHLDDLPREHRLKKHYIRYKELFPSVRTDSLFYTK